MRFAVAFLALIVTATLSGQQTGIVVIRGGSSKSPAAKEEAKKDDAARPSEEAGAPVSAEKPAKAAQPTAGAERVPQTRRVESYTYDGSGNVLKAPTSQAEQINKSGGRSVLTLQNIDGREVPYLTEEEKVVQDGPNESVTERRSHRYDTAGRPVSQQLVREEKRKLPDGTIETVITTYESDVNGRMQPVERAVSRERTTGNSTRTVTTSERPDINGGFSTYEQEESVETKRGENSAVIESVRRVASGDGRLVESEREQSVMNRSGSTSTTETKVWRRSAVNPEKIELQSRTIGKLVEQPDGSSVETVEKYGYDSGGATNVNVSGLHLQQKVARETAVGPSGETVQTTTTLSRSVAEPSRFGQKEVVRKVARPTADGERVETQVYDQGVNGRLRQTQSSVEHIQKQAP